MVKPLLMGLALILVMAFVVACGSAEEPTATPAPTAAPTAVPPTEAPTEAPEPTAMMEEEPDEDSAMSDVDPALRQRPRSEPAVPAPSPRDGDFSQLVGPAPAEAWAMPTTRVNLAGLERESYLFDSDYYRTWWRWPTSPTPRR